MKVDLRALGLPEKFQQFRPNQELMLDFLMRQTQRVKAACMPTGSGKSLVYVVYALIRKIPTAFVTMTRGLQDQLIEDFACVGMVDLRGRSNYDCGLRPDYSCEQGAAVQCPLIGTSQCPRSAAEIKAATSMLVTTNYDKWITSKKVGMGLQHIKQVVFDEGHVGPEAIAKAMQITLHYKEIEETLGLEFPGYPDFNDIRVWKPWARETKVRVQEEIRTVHSSIMAAGASAKKSWIKHYNHMRLLNRRLNVVATSNPDNWIVEEVDDEGFVFDPIWPGVYGESSLLMGIDNIVITTATMVRKTLHDMGIGKGRYERLIYLGWETENYAFMEADTDFNPADCPIYYMPTQFVDDRHPDRSMLWLRMDQWLAARQDRKGIIHTVSHERRREILANSRFRDYMIWNEEKELAAEKVVEFKNSDVGFLLSPSVGTGYDFPGRQCEHTFMAKIPFAPPSKIMKAREAQDREYRSYQAFQKMIQAFGRGARFKGDRCEGLIPDDNMQWFIHKFGHLATRSFHRVYRVVNRLPPPPPRMPAEKYVVTTF